MFKIGDTVEITDEAAATGMLDFLKGKGYEVELYAGCMVNIVNESGKRGWYSRDHFKLKEQEGTKVEKKECLFKEGQVVWDVRKGRGVVESISNGALYPGALYPVTVQFDNDSMGAYTEDGKYDNGDIKPSLYFSEPKIEAATEPVFEPTLKEGDVVIAIDTTATSFPSHVFTVIEENVNFVKTEEFGVMGKERWDFYRLGEKINFK